MILGVIKKNIYHNKVRATNKGFGILEIILGAAILGTVFGAASLFYQEGIQINRAALNRTQAAFLEGEGLEAARFMRDKGWENVSAPPDGTQYYLSWTGSVWATSTTSSLVNDIFEWSIEYGDVYRDAATNDIVETGGVFDAHTKKITSYVSWPEGESTTTRSVSAYLTDIFAP